MKPIRLLATETREGLQVSLSVSYKGKLPKGPERKKAALAMARRVVAELEAVVEGGEGRLSEIGTVPGGQTLTMRDDYLVERKEG